MTMLFIADNWLTQYEAELFAIRNFGWLKVDKVTLVCPNVALLLCLREKPEFIVDMSRDYEFTADFLVSRQTVPSLRDVPFHIGYTGKMMKDFQDLMAKEDDSDDEDDDDSDDSDTILVLRKKPLPN
jgi:hypothetical protein